MPIIWIGFSTASSPQVHRRRNRPKDLKTFVSQVVKNANPKAELIDLYFEVGADRACALIKDLDDYVAVKAVQGVLRAEYATKFLTAAQADKAIKEQRRIVPRPKPRPRPKGA